MSKYPYLTILQAAAPLPLLLACLGSVRCEGGKRAVRGLQLQAEAEAAGCFALAAGGFPREGGCTQVPARLLRVS